MKQQKIIKYFRWKNEIIEVENKTACKHQYKATMKYKFITIQFS